MFENTRRLREKRSIAYSSYARIHKNRLDIETLNHYDIPWEYGADAEHIVVLRECSQEDLDVLFEHTHRLRNGKLILVARRLNPRRPDRVDTFNRLRKLGLIWMHSKVGLHTNDD